MLDLVRLSERSLFPPGGPELYRQIALLTDLSPGHEVLDVACGPGITLEHLVTEYDVHGQGVDHDPVVVEQAEARARDRGLAARLQFQHALPDRLPYRDRIFDLVVGGLGLTAHAEPERAVQELVRVTKPGGSVVLVQLAWKTAVDPERRRILSDHLGVRPLMLVEWKRLLTQAGVENLHTEDWTEQETPFHATVLRPFPDFAEVFTVAEKLAILRKAWGRWRWKGVKAVLVRETEVHHLLSKGRLLGLDLVKGTRSLLASETTDGADAAAEASLQSDAEADDALLEATAPAAPEVPPDRKESS